MYKSCNLILHGLCFFADDIGACCNSPADQIDNQRPPILYENYKGDIIPADELFNKIHSFSDMFKNGGCPPSCKNCCFIQEKDWDEGNYINEITITNFSACNAKCIYCANTLSRENIQYKPYSIFPILKHYKDIGVIKEGVEFHISGGEFTIYPECEAIMEEFGVTNYAKIVISSNCIVYSEKIKQSIELGDTNIIHSLDCGSRELYKRIKGVDAFDTVVNNLKNYASSEKAKHKISLKYIIIPTINDNMKEFSKFLKVTKEIGLKRVIIEIEGRYTRNVEYKIDSYFIYLAKQMKQKAEKEGFNAELFPFLKQCMQDIESKDYSFFEILQKKLQHKSNKMFKELYFGKTK